MKGERKDTAAAILEAAHQLFYEKGYENATTREISARVGISKAALYHHFRNKEEILFRLCVKAADELVDNMRRAIARNVRSEKPLKERLTDIFIEYLRTYMKNENFNKILFHDMEYLPEDKKRVILDKEKENVHQLRDYLASLMKDGRIRKVHPTVATFSIIGSLHWLYFWYKPEGPLGLEEVAAQIADLFLYGMISSEPDSDPC